MKKIMNIFVLVAAAAMALASCQKNEIDAPAKQEVYFTINAALAEDVPEAKTAITDNGDGTYTPSWEGTEELGVLFSLPTAETTKADVVTFENKNAAGELASFQGSTAITENGTFYSFYPASAFEKGYGAGDARLDLKQEQTPTATSFDPSCDILVARPYDFEVVEGNVTVDKLEFKRIMSVLRIDLKTDFEDVKGDFVKSVSFTAGDAKIVGYARIFLENPDFTDQNWASSGDGWNKVTANYSSDVVSVAGENNSVYLVIAPVTIPVGQELTFEVETMNYSVTKKVTVTEKIGAMNFSAGNVNRINLTIKSENCTVKAEDDYSGTYAILTRRTEGGDYYYMTNDLGTASTKRFTAESAGTELPEEGVSLNASKLWEVSKSGDYYKVRSVETDQYITYASGNSANLGDEGIDFTIKKNDDGTYNLSYAASDETRYLSLNGTTGNDYFAMYKSGQRQDLNLIPAVQGEEPTTLVVTSPAEMDAAAGDGSFAFELTNPKDGVELTASEDVDWITDVTIGDGVVTYKVAANDTEDPRNAEITLTYGELTASVKVSQKGKTVEGETVEWVETAFADLKAGDQVVIVSTNGETSWAMSNDNGTSVAPSGVTENVAYAGGKLTSAPADNIIWYVGVSDSNLIFNANSDGTEWLYCTATNNGVRVGTNTNKAFAYTSNYLYNVGTSRYVGVYTANPDWRCYTSTNNNISGQTFYFFVKSGNAGGSEEPETPANPVQLTMSDITCSAQTDNSLTFTWPAVANATGYEVTFDNGTPEEVTTTTYTATGLIASTEYAISVKAVGDGTNYTTSPAKTQTGTTTVAQGSGDEGGEGGEAIEVSMSIVANKGVTGTKTISWTDVSGFIVRNDQASSSNTIRTSDSDHYRVYANSNLVFTAPVGKTFTKLVVTIDGASYVSPFKTSATSAGFTVSESGTIVTVTSSTPVSEMSITASAQFRINKVQVTLN